VGVLTALVAWYASAAGVVNGMRGAPFLPVGKPFGLAATRTTA
jgi:succinate-acetate transporter protein